MNNSIRKTKPKGIIFLVITAMVWGTSFIAQSIGMENVDAFTFNGLRTILGFLVLLPVIKISDYINEKKLSQEEIILKKKTDKTSIKRGAIVAIPFFFAISIQQFAFYYSTSGKIAFITAMYMFMVPILGLFIKKHVSKIVWCCVFLGFIGLFFLSINPSDLTGINKGDILAFICSIFYAIHILTIEKLSPGMDGVRISSTQFLIAGIISCCLMFIFEHPCLEEISASFPAIAYSGIMSCGVAYTCQIIGQKYTEATIASLILCAESVFAVIAGAIILHETLKTKEIIGCAIMLLAIVISQLSNWFYKPKQNEK